MTKNSFLAEVTFKQLLFNRLGIENFNVRISHNLGQKVGDKFTKLSKIVFSMECFTADFWNFLPINIKI